MTPEEHYAAVNAKINSQSPTVPRVIDEDWHDPALRAVTCRRVWSAETPEAPYMWVEGEWNRQPRGHEHRVPPFVWFRAV